MKVNGKGRILWIAVKARRPREGHEKAMRSLSDTVEGHERTTILTVYAIHDRSWDRDEGRRWL